MKQCAEAIILLTAGIPTFFSLLAIIQSICAAAHFALEGAMTATPRGCRLCLQCGGKVTGNSLPKLGKNCNRKFISHVAVSCPFVDNVDKFRYL